MFLKHVLLNAGKFVRLSLSLNEASIKQLLHISG